MILCLYRRPRNALPFRRRRPYRADYISRLWMQQHRFRTDSNSIASPEATSLYSETDIGSGHNADSPFGSILSCSTSIPSPRPLRFAFKPKTRNIYGDDTSLISSMPSPSGNSNVACASFVIILEYMFVDHFCTCFTIVCTSTLPVKML